MNLSGNSLSCIVVLVDELAFILHQKQDVAKSACALLRKCLATITYEEHRGWLKHP